MGAVKTLVENWVSNDPTAILWLVVTGLVFLSAILARSRSNAKQTLVSGWSLVEGTAQLIGFLVISVMFYSLLSKNYVDFNQIYGSYMTGGSLSNLSWWETAGIYGEAIVQQDLQVKQFISIETIEEIQPVDSHLVQPLYRNSTIEEPISQNSISGFDGVVTFALDDPVHQTDVYNAYTMYAEFQYNIVNPTDSETRLEFLFPLSSGKRLYQDIKIEMNGEVITSWQVDSGAIIWGSQMTAGEEKTVSVYYTTRGMEWFSFEIPEPREIIDFELEMILDANKYWPLTEPANASIEIKNTSEPDHNSIRWTINQAIMAPRLGVIFFQGWPYSPYHELVVTLPYAARALLLFLSLAMLTSLIFSAPLTLRQVVLLAGLFTIPSLILMAGGVPMPRPIAQEHFAVYQIWMIPFLSLVPLVLSFRTLRGQPRVPLTLTLVLMALFMIGYPLIGLLPNIQSQNAVDGAVHVVMIVYVFSATLFVRVQNSFNKREG